MLNLIIEISTYFKKQKLIKFYFFKIKVQAVGWTKPKDQPKVLIISATTSEERKTNSLTVLI